MCAAWRLLGFVEAKRTSTQRVLKVLASHQTTQEQSNGTEVGGASWTGTNLKRRSQFGTFRPPVFGFLFVWIWWISWY